MNSLRGVFLLYVLTSTVQAATDDVAFAEGTWVLNTATTEFGAGPFRSKSEILTIEKSSLAELAVRVEGEDWSGVPYHEAWRGTPDGALDDGDGDTSLRASFEWEGRDLLIVEKFPEVVARIRAHFSEDGRTLTAAYLNRNGDAVATWIYQKR